MKSGLVLEGGAMRGLFSAGVCDVMMEHHVEFDGMIGVSAGAAFGCNYKSHQPGRVLRYNLKYCNDPRYCSLRSLLKTGDLFGADFCYHEMPERLDVFDVKTFEASPMEFYVVCSDVETGKPVYHRCDKVTYDMLEWMRASASLPLVSRIVEVNGYKLLDGGICDSIPLRRFEAMGYDRNVVVLTQPKGYQKEPNKMVPLLRTVLKKYPRIIEAIARRHEIYNETLAYIEERKANGDVFVLRPEGKLPIKRVEHDPKVLQDVYDRGRAVSAKALPALMDFLKK